MKTIVTSVEEVIHVLAGNGLSLDQLKTAEEMIASLVFMSKAKPSVFEESNMITIGRLSFAEKVFNMDDESGDKWDSK